MTTRNQVRRLLLVTLAVLALALDPAFSEVGVTIRLNGQSALATPHVVGIIVDGPDPTSRVWQRYSADSDTRSVLNDQGEANGDGKPAVLFNTFTDQSMVAWSRNSPEGFDVVLSVFTAGTWTDPIVLAGSSEDELDPHLTMNPADGSVHLVYWVDDAQPRVMHREAPADLSVWTPAQQVSLVGEIAVRPAAAFHDGSLRVVYESHWTDIESTPRQIVLATRDGGGFTTEAVATTHFSEPNWPEVHSSVGHLWVDWIDDSSQMYWRRQQADASWGTFRSELFQNAEERDYLVRGKIKGLAIE
jgi:hypothetical protein